MIASTLGFLSGAALANAAGLKAVWLASLSGYGAANWTLAEGSHGYRLGWGAKTDPLLVSAALENGELKMACPYQLSAVLIPREGQPLYDVEFVSSTDGLPEGTIIGGWGEGDRDGLPNKGAETYTKVVNSIAQEVDGKFNLGGSAGEYLYWTNVTSQDRYTTEWWIVLDNAQDVTALPGSTAACPGADAGRV
ncbi:hypothetical protein HDZ31DRAFT_68092 [Schizophyllum fasciatum]